jgi:hypothetical protein
MNCLPYKCPVCWASAALLYEHGQRLYSSCKSCRKGGYWLVPATLRMLTDGNTDEGELIRRQDAARAALANPQKGSRSAPLQPGDLD